VHPAHDTAEIQCQRLRIIRVSFSTYPELSSIVFPVQMRHFAAAAKTRNRTEGIGNEKSNVTYWKERGSNTDGLCALQPTAARWPSPAMTPYENSSIVAPFSRSRDSPYVYFVEIDFEAMYIS
ncbi:MAG: hypothetical protein Q9211_005679, partial [Gyalolechia sp. 1 TL-2023]